MNFKLSAIIASVLMFSAGGVKEVSDFKLNKNGIAEDLLSDALGVALALCLIIMSNRIKTRFRTGASKKYYRKI